MTRRVPALHSLVLAAAAMAGCGDDGPAAGGPTGSAPAKTVGGMWLFGLLLVLGVVLLAVVLVRAIGGGVTGPPTVRRVTGARSGRARARELLDERYALGRLSPDEYRERLTALGEDS